MFVSVAIGVTPNLILGLFVSTGDSSSCMSFRFQSIYNQEVLNFGPGIAKFLNRENCRKMMSAYRTQKIPACPDNMDEFVHLMEYENSYPQQYRDMYWGHASYLEKKDNKVSKQHFGLLLGDKKLFETVTKESTFYFIDGTFRSTPQQARVLSTRGSQVSLGNIS